MMAVVLTVLLGAYDRSPVRHTPFRPRVVTDSQEISLGAALAAQFDIDRGIQPTPETSRIEAYLQRITDSLGRHARRRLPWKIHFDPHPGIKSGFALPGGHIVIWGGILAYMSTEDEAAALIAHEIEHIDDGQVTRRIDSLVRTAHRNVDDPKQWTWDEFGASYGSTLENLCDYKGAKLAVAAGYSPYGYKTLLESFVALGRVHAPIAPPPKQSSIEFGRSRRRLPISIGRRSPRRVRWDSLATADRARIAAVTGALHAG
jgi:predicted Zn-dependent protease